MDINHFAAHISEINLLFNTLDLYEIVRKKYPYYSIKRFNIVCTDTLLNPQETRGQTLIDDFLNNGRAVSYYKEQNEADRIKKEQFDLVIGNPPYVSIQNMNNREIYSEIYKDSAHANYDLYYLFLDKGVRWLNAGGKLGFINPNRFLNTDSADGIRNILLDYKITEIIDFKDIKVFDSSTSYPLILIVEKSEPKGNVIRCTRIARGPNNKVDEEMIDGISKHISENYIYDTDERWYDIFGYPQAFLGKNSIWCLMPDTERMIFEKIEKNADKRVEELIDNGGVFQGIITGKDEIYFGEMIKSVDKETVIFKPLISENKDYDIKEKEFPIERKILRRLLKSDSFDKWGVNWDGLYIIFHMSSVKPTTPL